MGPNTELSKEELYMVEVQLKNKFSIHSHQVNVKIPSYPNQNVPSQKQVVINTGDQGALAYQIWKSVWRLTSLELEFPYDTVISILGMYLNEFIFYYRDICLSVRCSSIHST